jgi:enoyl-[acyl-carrier protein] reductase III
MFGEVRNALGGLDIFVANARPDLPTFYRSPMELALDHWRAALDTQAQAFLLGAQEAARLMPDGSRIIAVTYSPGGRTGSWQPWAAMGSAKAALEALVRYFAVALGPRQITVNAVSPGGVLGPPNAVEGGVLRALPSEVQDAIRAWHEGGWTPMRRLATPEDVGNVVTLLCMEEAGFITGQVLHVDGGASIMDPVFPLDIQRGGES